MRGDTTNPSNLTTGAGPVASSDRKMALLVDGDSAPADLAAEMIAEAAKYGAVVIRRVYGNYGSPVMNNWTKASRDLAIESRHHTPAVSGKNSTDIALAIDAMELLCEAVVGGFCIVSSDSDFTGLAARLRAKGKWVLGIGRKGTPATLQQACDAFVHIETLKAVRKASDKPGAARRPSSAKAKPAPKAKAAKTMSKGTSKGDAASRKNSRALAEVMPLLTKAFEMTVTEEGIAHMSALGGAMHRLDASFDHRAFGKKQLIDLVEAFPAEFSVERPSGARKGVVVRKAKR